MKIHEITLTESVSIKFTYYQREQIADFNIDQKRPLVLILPGGGYQFHSMRESELIALNYLAKGIDAAILSYKLVDEGPVFPDAIYQVGEVVSYFNEHAEEFQIAADRIILSGFSAGGHLAALYADFSSSEWLAKKLNKSTQSLQLAALVLSYPVIDLDLGWPTEEEKKTILGDFTQSNAAAFVTSQNPSTYIWTTLTDETVPVTNSLNYIQELIKNDVVVRSQLFDHGRHGLSLAESFSTFPASFKSDEPGFGQLFVDQEISTWFQDQYSWLAKKLDLNTFWMEQ
ncbi:alpha/beta hydrolase [Enterococcus devriesei]|uniref:alpha/beta hydrolase n=1 Tax=Enterococcus devriesei TaxID=319970 RepID=UPI001C0F7329|nr:alpha/beta hydrolase [Enterococcus devriesei]MBU5365096.1 alpha/beta hydrolase [Enterococcus devriesei]